MKVIEVKDLSKKFRIVKDKSPTLKEKLIFWNRQSCADYWVLKNVSFNVEKGDAVALVGRNGSGKSTLLKVLTGILYPDRGHVSIQGRVSSLLELGAGFHTDFTGRENIFMNASIFGLSRREINEKIDSIINFSELGEFIDNPVRNYSSGMYMRLGFSVAIHVNPDVLLIDEVLAVGDVSFQKKCLEKIKEFREQGKTIIFVSHDLATVEKFCNWAVWLEEGEIREMGQTRKVLDAYLSLMAKKDEAESLLEHREREKAQAESKKEPGQDRWGSGEAEITGVKMFDQNGREKYRFDWGEPVTIKIFYRSKVRVEDAVFGVGIFSTNGVQCYSTNTGIEGVAIDILGETGVVAFEISQLTLLDGKYLLDVAVQGADGRSYDYRKHCYSFHVASNVKDEGVARIPHQWKFIQN